MVGFTGCRCAQVNYSGEFQLAPSASSTAPDQITLAVWNIWKAKDPASQSDLETLAALEKSDIVLTQEAPSDLPDTPGLGNTFACSWRYPWSGGKFFGVRTYSRIKPTNATALPSKFRELWITSPKVALTTEIPLSPERNLLAINFHALNFERFGTTMLAAQFENMRPKIASHEGPVVLAGDFNTWNHERLDLLDRFAANLKLKEVTTFPKGRKTGDMKSPFINRLLGIAPELPLDRVFLRGMKAVEATVLDYESSDHSPLLVRLQPE